MSSLGNKRNKPAAKTELVVTPQNYTPDQLLFKLR